MYTAAISISNEKRLCKATRELAESQRTYLVRKLKRKTMKNAQDLRGSQRLSILCDFLGKALQY